MTGDDEKSNAEAGPETSKSLATGFVCIMVMVVLFGSAPTFARLAFDGGSGPITLQALRFLLAAGAVGLYLAFHKSGTRAVPREKWPWLLALSVITGISSICYMTSVRYIQVGLASLIFFSFPLMVAAASHWLGLEFITRRKALALVIAFGGLVLVLGGDVSGGNPLGILLAFGAGVGVATNMIIYHRLSGHVAPTMIAFVSCVVSLGIFLIGMLIIEGWTPPASETGWIGIVGNSLSYAMGLICLYTGLRHLGPVLVSTISNLEPLISVAIAWMILGEILAPIQLTGAALVIFGISLAGRKRSVRHQTKK